MNFDSVNEEQVDTDEDDEFLFQSIQRYNTLQMFNLENPPQYLLQIDDFSICVASQRKKGENSELLKLKLPRKLTLPPEEEGRSKENDFKVLSGIYTESLLHQIDKLNKCNKIITSENSISGLQVYSFTDCLLGTNKSQQQKLNVTPWTKPNFAVFQESTHAICSKSSHEPLIQVDVSVGKQIREIQHPFSNLSSFLPETYLEEIKPFVSDNIKCKALGTYLIAVLNNISGNVVLYDLRTNGGFISLPKTHEKPSKEIWALSGCDYKQSSLDYFGIISDKKNFCIYDKRKNSVVIQNSESCTSSESTGHLTLKFSNDDKFSISGMNSFVEIYKINNDSFQHVFTHNGHCPRNIPSALVTDHMWLQTGGNKYVISICQNKTLHCWDFKA